MPFFTRQPRIRESATFDLLRRRLAEHNRAALGLSFASLAGCVAGWTLLYGVTYWLALLALSAVDGGDARLPSGFPLAFATVAGVLFAAGWADRRFLAEHRPRDTSTPLQITADVLLALPRMTLAIGENWSARQHLSPWEIEAGADLLERLTERPLPLHALPLEIPEEEPRGRVLFALLITEMAVLREADGVTRLQLAPAAKEQVNDAARELLES